MILVALLAMIPGLAACEHADLPTAAVAVLPDALAQGQAWDWAAGCQTGPTAQGTCAPANPRLGTAQLTGNEWNLGTSPGSLHMSVTASGVLAMKGELPSAPPCTRSACIAPRANTWVRGYPSVVYGLEQGHAATSPPTSPRFSLPTQVAAIAPDLVGTTSYSTHTSDVTYDVAYDLWLSRSATTSPCTTNGTSELVVWTDYDQQALPGEGMKAGIVTVPFAAGRTVSPGHDAWSVYVRDIYPGGRTAPRGGTVWLVLDKADTVSDGTVTVDISRALMQVGSLLERSYGWSDFASNYWVDAVPFGIEFGPQDGRTTSLGPTSFSLDLSAFCLAVRRSASKPAC